MPGGYTRALAGASREHGRYAHVDPA